MMKWIHHLLNPHCEECRLEKECPSCEVLKEQLASANREKQQMLDSILNKDKTTEVETRVIMPENMNQGKYIPWHVRRQMLESEDRAQAAIIAKKKKEEAEIAKLEKDVGIIEKEGA